MLLSCERCCKQGGNEQRVVENTWHPHRRISGRKQTQKSRKFNSTFFSLLIFHSIFQRQFHLAITCRKLLATSLISFLDNQRLPCNEESLYRPYYSNTETSPFQLHEAITLGMLGWIAMSMQACSYALIFLTSSEDL